MLLCILFFIHELLLTFYIIQLINVPLNLAHGSHVSPVRIGNSKYIIKWLYMCAGFLTIFVFTEKLMVLYKYNFINCEVRARVRTLLLKTPVGQTIQLARLRNFLPNFNIIFCLHLFDFLF